MAIRAKLFVRETIRPSFLTVLALLAITATSLGDRSRLGDREMDRCRGGDQMRSMVSSKQCDTLNGNAPCTTVGAACVACQKANYSDVGASAGNYNAGMPNGGSCSNLYSGMCIPQGGCYIDPNGNTGMACATPPGKPLVQAQVPLGD